MCYEIFVFGCFFFFNGFVSIVGKKKKTKYEEECHITDQLFFFGL